MRLTLVAERWNAFPCPPRHGGTVPARHIKSRTHLATSRLATPSSDFFFVQIGAFDGREGDHLHGLIRRNGWHGVLVEPQPQAFDFLKQNYADCRGLRFFNVAIAPANGTITLYTRNTGCVPIASVSKRLLIKPGHSRSEVMAIDVPCWTFDRLLDEAKIPGQIDLLQIDTEGFDFEIIRSIRFERCKPRILRFEHALLSNRDQNACLQLLADNGYRFLLEDRDTIAMLPADQ